MSISALGPPRRCSACQPGLHSRSFLLPVRSGGSRTQHWAAAHRRRRVTVRTFEFPVLSKRFLGRSLLVLAIMAGIAVVPALAVSLYVGYYLMVPRYSSVAEFE